MKQKIISFITSVLLLWIAGCSTESPHSTRVLSPDKRISVTFILQDGIPYYAIDRLGNAIISDSRLGFRFKDAAPLDRNLKIIDTKINTIDQTWTQPWGEVKNIRNHYNELVVSLQETTALSRRMNIIFKVYDDGVGFRYELPEQKNLTDLQITDELTEFALSGNHSCWWIGAYQGNRYEFLYNNTRLNEIDTVHTPFTMETTDGIYLSIHEANLTDYASMTLARVKDNTLSCDLVPWSDGIKVKGSTPIKTPWRTIQIAGKPGDLISSHLILNLNEPNQLEDIAWIKPDKYIGIWWGMHLGKYSWGSGEKHGATTENAKTYIDFAAKHGFSGVLVEGWNTGWDGNWIENGSLFNFTQPHPDFDIEEVTGYAAAKGVEIIGHHETGADIINYEKQLEEAFAFYEKYGINTVKTGYVGHGRNIKRIDSEGKVHKEWHHGQYMVRHYRKVVETAAEYQIMLDVHEPIKDTGIRRTFPNMMTREGARGMEFNAWSPDGGNPPDYMTILPFTRLLSGPMDFTPGILDLFYEEYQPKNRVNTTLAKMLAYYVVIYSPLHMAADLPGNYENQAAFQFIKDVPVDWEYTKALHAKIGDYITIVRKDRNSDDWYLGSVTDENPRILKAKLDFLKPDQTYIAEIYADADDANWENNPLVMTITKKLVKQNTALKLHLAPGGGQAIRIHLATRDEIRDFFASDEKDGTLREYHHPDPHQLITGYLERDSKGKFMQSSAWWRSAMYFPRAPGWDQATLISGYDIDTISVNEENAEFSVNYHMIARISQNARGPYLIYSPRDKPATFILNKTEYGWRIAKPIAHPHVLPESIMERLPQAEQDSLRKFLNSN
ncbi:MAG: glycoside hydrolase family 97 protein [Candidatus Marinimicrobia bacterium]|nr:glycoside hydrolase family 97 protein [Candidatus Neomarinimicrobiota bacterium]